MSIIKLFKDTRVEPEQILRGILNRNLEEIQDMVIVCRTKSDGIITFSTTSVPEFLAIAAISVQDRAQHALQGDHK